MRIDKLPVDSELFQLNVGSYTLRDVNDWNQREVDKWDLIYIITDPADISSNEFLLSRNVFLADKKTTFVMKIPTSNDRTTTLPRIHSYNASPFDQQVIDIGIQSSLYSRFMVDKRFPKEKAREMYRIWMRRSIDRELADEVLICKNDREEIMGVITVGKKDQRAHIGILAVDKRYRGQQVGKELVQAAIDYSRKHGYSALQVVTQGTNLSACQFYESCGFTRDNVNHLYHYWITAE